MNMKKLIVIIWAAILATCGLWKATADTNAPVTTITNTVVTTNSEALAAVTTVTTNAPQTALSRVTQSVTNTVTLVTNNIATVITTVTTTTTTTITNLTAQVTPNAGGTNPPTVKVVKVNVVVPPPTWQSVATFGATVAKGNSDTVLLTASVVTAKKTPKNEVSLGADASYGEQSSVESVDRLHAFAQWNHLYNSKFYYYNRADGLHDGIADIDYQFTLSPGVGYFFIKDTNTLLSLEVGPGLATERLGGIDDTYATLRIGQKFDHKFNSQVHIWENVEFLPEVDKWEKYSVNFEIGVETAITKSLSLKTMLQDNYVNLPANGRKDNDIKLISGISYKF